MERDDIIRMAREAGAMFDHMTWVERDLAPVFERFAALVAAEKDKQIAELQNDFDRVNSQSKTNLLYAARAIEERETARREEREACARVCEEDGLLWGKKYAAAIRARGEK